MRWKRKIRGRKGRRGEKGEGKKEEEGVRYLEEEEGEEEGEEEKEGGGGMKEEEEGVWLGWQDHRARGLLGIFPSVFVHRACCSAHD